MQSSRLAASIEEQREARSSNSGESDDTGSQSDNPATQQSAVTQAAGGPADQLINKRMLPLTAHVELSHATSAPSQQQPLSQRGQPSADKKPEGPSSAASSAPSSQTQHKQRGSRLKESLSQSRNSYKKQVQHRNKLSATRNDKLSPKLSEPVPSSSKGLQKKRRDSANSSQGTSKHMQTQGSQPASKKQRKRKKKESPLRENQRLPKSKAIRKECKSKPKLKHKKNKKSKKRATKSNTNQSKKGGDYRGQNVAEKGEDGCESLQRVTDELLSSVAPTAVALKARQAGQQGSECGEERVTFESTFRYPVLATEQCKVVESKGQMMTRARNQLCQRTEDAKRRLNQCEGIQQFKTKILAKRQKSLRPFQGSQTAMTDQKRRRASQSKENDKEVEERHSPCKRAKKGREEPRLGTLAGEDALSAHSNDQKAANNAKTDSTTEEEANTPKKQTLLSLTVNECADLSSIGAPQTQSMCKLKGQKAQVSEADKELKKVVNYLESKRNQEKHYLQNMKTRAQLAKIVDKALKRIPQSDKKPFADRNYTHIRSEKGRKQRAYIFEFEEKSEESKDLSQRKVVLFTINDEKAVDQPIAVRKSPRNSKKQGKRVAAQNKNSQEQRYAQEESKVRGSRLEEKAIQGKQQAAPTATRGDLCQKRTEIKLKALNSLNLCLGRSQADKNEAHEDATQQQKEQSDLLGSSLLKQFSEQRVPYQIPKVTNPKKVTRGKQKAASKSTTQSKAKSGQSKSKLDGPQQKLSKQKHGQQQNSGSSDIQTLLQMTAEKAKKASASKRTKKKNSVDIELKFDNDLGMNLPPIPMTSDTAGSKPKSANYQEPGGPVELPPSKLKFIAEESIHYNGNKLHDLKENDMVCKLVYGQLNRSVEVSKKDFKFLEPGVYLNDILILFYLRFLQYYVIPKPLDEQVYIFDPQFFTKLQESPQNLAQKQSANGDRYQVSHGYKSVKRWTRKTDLFLKDYILVPICQDQHWTLAIICQAHLVEKQMREHIRRCKEAEETKMDHHSIRNEVPDTSGLPREGHKVLSPAKKGIRETMMLENPLDEEMKELGQGGNLAAPNDAAIQLDQTDSQVACSQATTREKLEGGGGRTFVEAMSDDEDLHDEFEDSEDAHYGAEVDDDEMFGAGSPSNFANRDQVQFSEYGEEADDYGEDLSDQEDEYDQYQALQRYGQQQQFMSGNATFASMQQSLRLKKRPEMPKEASKDKPIILFMDSLSAENVEDMMQYLREYLELEFIEKKVDAADKKYFMSPDYQWKIFDFQRLPHYCPMLPKQRNFYDCGLFVLQYAETFLLQPDFVLKDLRQEEGELFHRRVVNSKRDEIMRIIIAIAEQSVSVAHMGQVYLQLLQAMQGKKTHYLKPQSQTSQEESKIQSCQGMELEEEASSEKKAQQSRNLNSPPANYSISKRVVGAAEGEQSLAAVDNDGNASSQAADQNYSKLEADEQMTE